jgi:uncharacterized DUF497 family protein
MESDDVVFGNFLWNNQKNEENKRKHKIAFEEAVGIFNDPFLYEIYDEVNSKLTGEDRYNVIGRLRGIALLFVSTTDREMKTRIISARRAESREEEAYDENIKKIFGY